MKLNKLFVLLLTAAVLLAACSPANGVVSTATPMPEPTLTPFEDHNQPPAAVSEAQKRLAEQLGVPVEEITINSIEEMVFSDSCLGLGGPAESCLMATVRGYLVMMSAAGQTYEVRTSLDGEQIRFAGEVGGSGGKGAPGVGGPEAGVADTPVVAAAREFLAGELKVSPDSLILMLSEPVQWPDSCLGVARPEEMCATVITPGYRVVFESEGMQYQVNTNRDGSALRMAGGVEAMPGGPGLGIENGESEAAVNAARDLLAQQLSITTDQIDVARVEAVQWPDGCLGLGMAEQMCTQAIVPGYLIVLEHAGKVFEFRTDAAGGKVMASVPQLPETATRVVAWELNEGGTCNRIEVGAAGVRYSACGQEWKQVELSPERTKELAALFINYGVFSGETETGTVTFEGQGAAQPSEVEIRSVAEWARLVYMEAEGGRGSAAQGLAMAWHQEGGIAGFCSDLAIYRSGLAQPTSCKAGRQGVLDPYRMRPEDLKQLYAWVDTLASFEYEQDDNVAADGMLTRLIFTGEGTQKATAAQQQMIAEFAGRIYLESTR